MVRLLVRLGFSTSNIRMNKMKELWIVRHGQATHNPRAESAREKGCTYEEFLNLIKEDDSFDSPLTTFGENQAILLNQQYFSDLGGEKTKPFFDLIVSSPLSRALQTANLVFPPNPSSQQQQQPPPRLCYENWREIHGIYHNAQRRNRSELNQLFADWDFQLLLGEQDPLWKSDTLESIPECRERGYQALCWLLQYNVTLANHDQQSKNSTTKDQYIPRVLVVTHGAILHHTLKFSECVQLKDDRTNNNNRSVAHRFGNAEMRRYHLQWEEEEEEEHDDGQQPTKKILLTELDLPSLLSKNSLQSPEHSSRI